MAYSKVSLICGLLTFLVISIGVSARWLDDLAAKIKEDIEEDESNIVGHQKPAVEMVNSHVPAPEMSAYQLSAAGKAFGFEPIPMGGSGAKNDRDEDEDDSNVDFDSTFQPSDTDDDNNATGNSEVGPLP